MSALFRYTVLKSSRESFLYALLFSPAVMIVVPVLGAVLGAAAISGLQGRTLYPISLDPRYSPMATSRIVSQFGATLATLAAGVGGFWIFRREVANHSLGSFMLAVRPRAIVLAATLYGALAGIASFLIVIVCDVAMTTQLPAGILRLVMVTILSATAASSLGVLLLAVSAESTMLAPVYAGSLAIATLLWNQSGASTCAAILAWGTLQIVSASLIMRRRCAI